MRAEVSWPSFGKYDEQSSLYVIDDIISLLPSQSIFVCDILTPLCVELKRNKWNWKVHLRFAEARNQATQTSFNAHFPTERTFLFLFLFLSIEWFSWLTSRSRVKIHFNLLWNSRYCLESINTVLIACECACRFNLLRKSTLNRIIELLDL